MANGAGPTLHQQEQPLTEQQTLDLPGPRISRITIGRLHNLGNYEHVRYEVTVDLPPGTSPASVLHRTEQLLNALEPRGPYSLSEVSNALREIRKPMPKLADFVDGRGAYNDAEQSLRHATLERERAESLLKRHDEWRARRDAAHRRFDELGGVSVYTDAKDRWDEDEIPY
jgi:hypothetical protein